MSDNINWAEVKSRYKTGLYSMDQLARVYNFNAEHGLVKAIKNGWGIDRTKNTEEIFENRIIDMLKIID